MRVAIKERTKQYELALHNLIDERGQWHHASLAKLYHHKASIRCLCTTNGIDMHVRRVSAQPPRFTLVTNPKEQHDRNCRFYREKTPQKTTHSPNGSQSQIRPSTALIELNIDQDEAASHIDGPCLVVAAAGAGKTKTLIARITHLIDQGVRGRDILACTFTKKATTDMRQRLEHATGERAADVSVGTMHSIAYKMLRTRLDNEWKVLTDPYWLVEHVIQTEPALAKIKVQDAFADIQRAKADGHTPDQVRGAIGQIYAAYEKAKTARKMFDFDDLLLYATRLLREDKTFRDKWGKRWRYIMVDEFQDTNTAQWHFLLQLVKRTSNLFAVGDDWQAIYGFRGARPDLMINFKQQFPDSKIIKLTTNYRSHDLIVELANSVIELNRGHRIEKTVIAARDMDDSAVAQAVKMPTDVDEAKFVAKEIKQARKAFPDMKWNDIAVLYRTNVQSRLFEEVLANEDIPCNVIGDKHFYESIQIKILLDYLRVTQDTSDSSLWGPLLNRPNRYISRDTVLAVTAGGWSSLLNDEKCHEFIETIRGLTQYRKPDDALKWLVDVHPGLVRQDPDEPIKWFDALLSSAKRFRDIPAFLQYVDWLIQQGQKCNKDAVQLMTIHRSKGLEFETVFVTGITEGLLPHKKSETIEDIREETRLCYVALTRAKQNLYLLSAEKYGETPMPPSRFFEAIQGGE